MSAEASITTHDAHTISSVATGNNLHATESGELKAHSNDKSASKHAHKIHHKGRHGKGHKIAIQHHETGKMIKAGKAQSADEDTDGPNHQLWAAISADAASGTHHLHHIETNQILTAADNGAVKLVPHADADLKDPKTQWKIEPTTVPAATVVAGVTAGAAPAAQPQPPHPSS